MNECGIPEYFRTLLVYPRWVNQVRRVHVRPGWRVAHFLNENTKRTCMQYVQTLAPAFATEVFRFVVRIHMQSYGFWCIALLATLPNVRQSI